MLDYYIRLQIYNIYINVCVAIKRRRKKCFDVHYHILTYLAYLLPFFLLFSFDFYLYTGNDVISAMAINSAINEAN